MEWFFYSRAVQSQSIQIALRTWFFVLTASGIAYCGATLDSKRLARLANRIKRISPTSADFSRQTTPGALHGHAAFLIAVSSPLFYKPSLVLLLKGVVYRLLITLYLLLWMDHLMEAVRL